MTRRKQNCPKRMKWEGGEGEEPPEDLQEDEEDGDEEEDEASTGPDSRAASPITSTVIPNDASEQPIVDNEIVSGSVNDLVCSDKEIVKQSPPITPPPPVLERCSSSESMDSVEDESEQYQQVPPRLSTMVSSSPLISSSSSPPLLMPAQISPPAKSPITDDEDTALDFSTKKRENPSPVLNLSKTPTIDHSLNGPLDLSVGSNKKRSLDDPIAIPAKKPPRMPTAPISPWLSPLTYQLPYFAPGNIPLVHKNNMGSVHQDTSHWNGKAKAEKNYGLPLAPSDATKALEKMSELSKLAADEFRPVSAAPSINSGRHSAWQSHWLNKGAEQAKDVLKCVWCKQSFPSLAAMTTHMQEAKHCGVNVPGVSPIQSVMTSHSQTPTTSISSPSTGSSKSSSSDLNLLIKETMPLPRKLVRGQDVWLGKGAEQTRQILKCMWCGQSFRSLAEMTSHMQQTQHYTNIISQEQIISWKSSEEGKSGHTGNGQSGTSGSNSSSTNSHVSAVLTCKVCDQAFSSLKELSNHMVKNSHYKEHIMRSITESGGRRRQTREKRKKSLPVRKLLELERAQNEMRNGDSTMMSMMMMGKSAMHAPSSRITCDRCGEKIDVAVLVDHIRICVGGLSEDKKNLLKNALLSYNASETYIGDNNKTNKEIHQRLSPRITEPSNKDVKQDGKSSSPSVLNAIEKLIEKSFDPRSRHGMAGYPGAVTGNSTSPIGSSILKRLGIDESVDYTKPLMDVNLQAAKAYILGSQFHNNSMYDQNYFTGKRERSGSESSSVSERGSSRHDSMTPDHRTSTPRTTPEKRTITPPSSNKSVTAESPNSMELDIKKEPKESDEEASNVDVKLELKQEVDDNDDEEKKTEVKDSHHSSRESTMTPNSIPPHDDRDASGEECSKRSRRSESSPIVSPGRSTTDRVSERASASPGIVGSPANSERSITPRSTADKKSAGSLGALSSMFDNLSGSNAETPVQTKVSSHPLAALQKLCDKTETHHHPNTRSTSSLSANHSSGGPSPQTSTPGAILAFSWACNDAVITDSIMKCAFCDTPFISKGAYRHHLSKMHFVKDGVIPDPVPLKTPTTSHQTLPTIVKTSSHDSAKSGSNSSSSAKSPQAQSFDESPHSKFLKYTELAKQLSSKYV